MLVARRMILLREEVRRKMRVEELKKKNVPSMHMHMICIDRIDRSTLNVKFCQENDSTCFVVCITFDTCSLYNS